MKTFVVVTALVTSLLQNQPIRPVEPQLVPKSDKTCDVVRDAFVSTQFDLISKTLTEKFADKRQFMIETVRVNRLEQGQYTWAAVVKITTFEGPHNPPYHNYTLTIVNTLGGQPIVADVKRTN